MRVHPITSRRGHRYELRFSIVQLNRFTTSCGLQLDLSFNLRWRLPCFRKREVCTHHALLS